MAAQPTSLVADDLVDLVRDGLAGVEWELNADGRALRYADGRIVATELAIMELLVEIRDLLRDEIYEPSIDELRDGAGS